MTIRVVTETMLVGRVAKPMIVVRDVDNSTSFWVRSMTMDDAIELRASVMRHAKQLEPRIDLKYDLAVNHV